MFHHKFIKCLALMLAAGYAGCWAQLPTITLSQVKGIISDDTPVEATFSLERYNEMTGLIRQESHTCMLGYSVAAASQCDKKSYEVTFINPESREEEDVNLLGLRGGLSKCFLDAMAADRSCMSSRVAIDIFNSFARLPYPTDYDGRIGTVGTYVELWNGENYEGLFCLSDRIDSKLLGCQESGTGTARGIIYKCDDFKPAGFLTTDGTTPNSSDVKWNGWSLIYPDTPSADAWDPLLHLTGTPWDSVADGAYADTIRKHFYWDNLVDVCLLSMAVGIDFFGFNTLFLACPDITADQRFIVVPAVMDNGFSDTPEYSYANVTANRRGLGSQHRATPFSRLTENASLGFLTSIAQRWEELSAGPLSVENVEKTIYAYASLLDDTGAWQNNRERWNGNPVNFEESAQSEAEEMVAWYRQNHQQITELLARYLPANIKTANTTSQQADDTWYDLQGRIVNPAGMKKNVYIHHNKKVIAR